jgi:hypothetical protein
MAPLGVVGHDGEEAVHGVHEPGVGEDREADDDRGEVGHRHQSVSRGGAEVAADVPEHLGLVAGGLIV